MFWHIDTDIVSLIVMVAVYVCDRIMPPQAENRLRDKQFRRCLETGIVVAVIDVAASIVMEVPTPRPLYHLLMTAYFVIIEYAIVAWFLYALTILYQAHEWGRRVISRIVLTIYALYALFNCLNPWTGLVYTLGPDNTYSRGPFFALMLVLYSLFTLALLCLILLRWKQIPREYSGGVLLMTPILIAIGIVVQLSVPGLLLILPAYMICLVLAFLFLQTMRARSSQKLMDDLAKAAETDQLTGLFNRVGMEAMVEYTLRNAYGQGVVVLIADIDDLKIINDTMGHAEGDRSIRLMASVLQRHFRSGDTVVRYGGDEFLAFFTGNFDETQVNRSLARLVEEMEALRIGEHNDVPLRGSVGAAFGVVGRDTFETLCGRADCALYYVKRNQKGSYALYHPGMGGQ